MQILDLLGRQFEVKLKTWKLVDWRIEKYDVPQDWAPCYTRDLISGQEISIFSSPDKKQFRLHIASKIHPALLVSYELTFLEYHPENDIRVSHKYKDGKKKPNIQ